jgi:ribosome-binding protein aMBF1 (putative translation factor)
MTPIACFTVGGVELVVLRRRDLARLRGIELPPTEAEQIGARLRAAREHAELSQAELAERLGLSQPVVCEAERAKSRVGAKYIARVLAACDLPDDWQPKKTRKTKK